MTTAPARVSISRGGREQALPLITDPTGEVTRLLQLHAHASDVTVSIQLPDNHGLLLIAVEAGYAFVGLQTSGRVYQYLADARAEGTRHFVMGGQTTAVEMRYVLPIPKAVELATACLTRPDALAGTAWERQ